MEIEHVRFVGGFARAGTVTPAEYKAAKPDVIAEFSGPIAGHMNEDHMEATIAMVQAVPTLLAEARKVAMMRFIRTYTFVSFRVDTMLIYTATKVAHTLVRST